MVAISTLTVGLVLSAGGETVLLDFYSETCEPCRRMAPAIEQLARRGYPIRKVNVSRDPGAAARFRVVGVPCFVMLVDGREVAREVGIQSPARLEQMLALARRSPGGSEPPIQLASGPGRAEAVRIPAVRSVPAFGDLGWPSSATAQGQPPRSPPGWRMVSPDWAPEAEPRGIAEADLIAATVRLRVDRQGDQSCGSGTIIDARNGEALILTCGHLFRDSQGRGRIEVDVFGPTPQERLPGTLVHFDADRDVGLVSIRPPQPVKAARVAPAGYKVAKGAKVLSVGCDGGHPPNVLPGVVTALDRFLGAPNLTASGLPVEGRSGGGLFTSDGLVIGVCNAALPEEREGFYAALGSIHAVIDTANLSFVYRPEVERPGPSGPMVAVNPPAMPRHMPPPEEIVQPTDMTRDLPASGREAVPSGANPKGSLTPEERAALEEIERRKAAGAEVICVIRPRDNPQARSEIIVLDRASPEFLRSLTGRDRATRRAPETAASSLPPPPGVVSVRNAVASSEPRTEAPEWKPRWLQPGYQGE